MNFRMLANYFNLKNIYTFLIVGISSLQFSLLTDQILFPIFYFLLFFNIFYLFSKFERHELISYKIISIFVTTSFLYICFFMNSHQIFLFYLTFVIPLFFVFSLNRKVFYSSVIFNSIFQLALYLIFQFNTSITSQNFSFLDNYLEVAVTFISTQVIILYIFRGIKNGEKNREKQLSLLQTELTEISTKLHKVYFSKDKTSEITYRFHQFIYNLENTNAHMNYFLEEIKNETLESEKKEGDIYHLQKNVLETINQMKTKNEEEQLNLHLFQKEAYMNLGETNEDIKKIEFLINTNQYNEQDINELINSISTIYSIIEMVRGISNQINLLSLNAAIESSKSGDTGKGFSVIAKEIKYLQLEVLNSLTEITLELANIERFSAQIKEGTKTIDKKAEELKTERTMHEGKMEFITLFTKTFMEMIDNNSQMFNIANKDIDSSLKKLSETIDSTNRISEGIQESSVHFTKQKKTTNELKKMLDTLQNDLKHTTSDNNRNI